MQEPGISATKTDGNNANENKDQPVTISAPPAAAVTIDPQNPLPEGSFMWRRLFAAAISANALVFVWFAAAWLVGGQQWDQLYGLTKLMIYGAGLILTYYFIAPSAAELTNMIQSASIIKHSLATAAGASGLGAGAPKQDALTPDSQIPVSGPGEAPRAPGGDVGNSADVDVAPRGRT
jgi:hypothetical protein